MKEYQFSNKTLEALLASGWTSDRNIDISQDMNLLEEAGYSVFPAVQDFLRQFGGLRIEVAHPLTSVHQRFLDLNVEHALRGLDRESVEWYGEDIGTKFCKLGIDVDNITYVMNPAGKMYGLYSGDIFLIGDSGEQAIDNWCNWHPQLAPFVLVYTIGDEN